MSDKVQLIELNDKPLFQKLLDGEPQTRGMKAGRVYLQPGESCGEHSTENKEEVLMFTDGEGQAMTGEEQKSFQVGRGKVCYIPPNTIHNIKNTGSGPLVYIYCVTPVE